LIEIPGTAWLLFGVNAKVEVTEALASEKSASNQVQARVFSNKLRKQKLIQPEVKCVTMNGGEDMYEEGCVDTFTKLMQM